VFEIHQDKRNSKFGWGFFVGLLEKKMPAHLKRTPNIPRNEIAKSDCPCGQVGILAVKLAFDDKIDPEMGEHHDK